MMNIASALLLASSFVHAQSLPPEAQLSEWALPRWEAVAKTDSLKLSVRINPFILRGDFDGDGKADLALFVESTKTRKYGVVFLHRNGSKPHVLGAGAAFGNGGDNFDWMDIWVVQERGSLHRGNQGRKFGLRADAVLLVKESSASALVYFEDGEYKWQQQGD